VPRVVTEADHPGVGFPPITKGPNNLMACRRFPSLAPRLLVADPWWGWVWAEEGEETLPRGTRPSAPAKKRSRTMADHVRLALDALDASICLVDGQGKILYANQAAHCLFERDPTGIDLAGPATDDDTALLASVAERYRAAKGSGQALRELMIVPEQDGPRHCWLTLTPASPQAGAPRLLMLQDISDALTGSAALNKILSHVRHDLRSPLTSILGAAELLLSGRVGELQATQQRLAKIIEGGARKMDEILAKTDVEKVRAQEAALEAAGETGAGRE